MQAKRAAVIVNPVDVRIMGLTVSHSSEHVDRMPLSLQCSGQFGDVNAYAAYRNRMQRLPGQHRDSHGLPATQTFWITQNHPKKYK